MTTAPPTLEHQPPQPSRTRWGFLLTLIFATGLIVLIAIIVPSLTRGPRHLPDEQTMGEITNLAAALDTYNNDTGTYPTTAQGLAVLISQPPGLKGWNGPYVDTIPNDQWGHPFQFLSPPPRAPGSYTLRSAGPDGVPGTPDDLERIGG